MVSFRTRVAPLLALGLAASAGSVGACTGVVGRGGGDGSGGAPGANGGSGGGGSAQFVTPACAWSEPSPGRSPLRRLSLTEYLTTVSDLLGVDTSKLGGTFPQDQLLATQGSNNNAAAQKMLIAINQWYATQVASLITQLKAVK